MSMLQDGMQPHNLDFRGKRITKKETLQIRGKQQIMRQVYTLMRLAETKSGSDEQIHKIGGLGIYSV
jgi:hypothetical protein